MPPKRQFTHFKEAKKLAKQSKIEIKSDTLTRNTSVLLKDELTSIENLINE